MIVVAVRGKRVHVEERNVPPIGEGEILVGMKACGVCGTDLFKLRNGLVEDGTVLGHEVTGVVVESRSDRFTEGDRVFVPHHVPCGECMLCVKGSPTMCGFFKKTRIHPGGWAQFIRVERPAVEKGVRRIPHDIDFETATAVEPLACCMRSIRRSGFKQGDSVVIVGSGQTGCFHMMLLANMEPSALVACDIREDKIARAIDAGATAGVNLAASEADARLKELLPEGADVAFVTTESPAALESAVKMLRAGGTVVVFAHVDGDTVNMNMTKLLKDEKTITTAYSSTPQEQGAVLEFLEQGIINTENLKCLAFPLERAIEAIDEARRGECRTVLVG